MKLYPSSLTRQECLDTYHGYTEFNNQRYALKESSLQPPFEHNAIIFGYEYTKNMAETGYTQQMVEHILKPITFPLSQHPTHGGYVNQQGQVIEEKGMILIYDKEVSPVSLGALAYKIADTFRQESVLVIYKNRSATHTEAQFIYV